MPNAIQPPVPLTTALKPVVDYTTAEVEGSTIVAANAPTGEFEWDQDAAIRKGGFDGASEGRTQ